MQVNTSRFGVLDIDDSSVVRMPRGPLGFEDQTEFCMIQHRPDTCFRWLQSVSEPTLAFVVVEPSDFVADYEIEISDAEAEMLKLGGEEDAQVLAIVTIGRNGGSATANLAAPIVVNTRELIGMQVVLQDDKYSIRHSLITQVKDRSMENIPAKAA